MKLDSDRQGIERPCPWFNTCTKTLQSNQITAHQQQEDLQPYEVTWCNHEHSPLREPVAMKIARSHLLLTCGGNLAQCTVPEAQR